MYPNTLNMTRDECRGILRRLELETYSSVISTFRAQGGLSEIKLKLLDDLRGIFHISPDRHRAEARRVANDEQLGTIAEAISGPNTYQEWCREGRRSFPLLPRSAPLTAFSNVANAVLERATDENSKMPYPSETYNMRSIEDFKFEDANKVVQEDPVLAGADEKRNLKRSSLSLADHIATNVPLCKRKSTSGDGSHLNSQTHVHTNTKIQQLYHNHSKTQSRHKKLFSKRSISANVKKLNSPSTKALQSRVVKPLEIQAVDNKTLVPNPGILHSYASVQQHKAISGSSISDIDSYGTNKLPQIATSKKDITKNLSKLNLSQMSANPQNRYAKENDLKPEKISGHLQKYTGEDHSFIGNPYSGDVSLSGKKGSTPLPFQTGRIKQNSFLGTKHIKAKTLENQVAESSSAINVPGDDSIGNHNIKHSNSFSLQPGAVIYKTDNDHHCVQLITSSEPKMTPTTDLASPLETKKITSDAGVIMDGGQHVQNTTKVSMQPNANKPKIQITSQQILSPIISNIKFPLGMQLKGVQSRKGVKILTSTGKMLIQSLENSKIGKLNTVIPQKNINQSSVMRTPVISTRPLTVQKLQLVPSSSSRQVTMHKPNVLLMSTSIGSTPGSGTFIKSVPISKSNKAYSHDLDKTLDEMQNSNLSKVQNNVVVIGTVPIGKPLAKDEDMLSNSSCIITEDTPVDILTTPISNAENTLSSDEKGFEIKQSMINLNECIVKNTLSKDSSITMNSNDIVECGNLRTEKMKGNEITQNEIIGTTTDWEMELDQEVNKMRNSRKKLILTNKSDNEQDNEGVNSDDHFHDVIEEETVDDDEGVLSENTVDPEDGIEFDVTCGSVTDEIDENVAIEYVEDTTANSFEEAEEVYVHKEEDIYLSRSNRNQCEVDVDELENFNNNTNTMQCNPSESVSNGNLNMKRCLNSPSFMYEIRQIDENTIKQGKYVNKTPEDFGAGSTTISGSKRGISN